MIKGIDHIDIAVKDVEAAIEVFQKMGFELLCRTVHEGGAAELKLPGANQPIFELHPVRLHYKYHSATPGIYHIAFLVDNAQETYDNLKAEGFTIKDGWDGPRFLADSGRNMVDTAVIEEWGELFLQFVEKGRKPPITRQKGEAGISH